MSRRVRPVLRRNFNAQRNAEGLPDWPEGVPLPRGLRARDGYPRPLLPEEPTLEDVEATMKRGEELVLMRGYFAAATRLGYGKDSPKQRRALRKLEQTIRDLNAVKAKYAELAKTES